MLKQGRWFKYQQVLSITRKELIDFAVKQYTRVEKTIKTGVQYPIQGTPESEEWFTANDTIKYMFRSGMYSGVLWHLYNYTGAEQWKQLAIKATDGMFSSQFITTSHDIGFNIDNSYGLGYDLTKNSSYPDIIINAAKHIATRYSDVVGCIRSWNSPPNHHDEFVVIVDNMMNLELLFRAHILSGNQTYYDMAVSHANKTIENHLRKDYSSWHVVAYNQTDGTVSRKYTAQGYSDSSCWSRGQAWLIHGFMSTYRYTKNNHFLQTAQNVGNYYVDNLPDDGIAFWDFDVPKDKYKYIPRDSSSAAIASTGLFQLYEDTKNTKYLLTAKKIMNSLSSPKYRADGKKEYKIPALIVNGTISGPNTSKGNYDLALSYGDFYFIESFRYLN